MKWFTSDTHFGHKPVIQFCNRPYMNVEDMEIGLLENINNAVKPDDTLYVLGDFAFVNGEHITDIVRGIKCPVVLIRGNHDHRIKRGKEDRYGFVDCFSELDLIFGNHRVILSHYPYRGDHTSEERFKDKRPKDVGTWLLHGHVHTAWKIKREERMINCGVDVWNYAPISEIDVLNIIEGRL